MKTDSTWNIFTFRLLYHVLKLSKGVRLPLWLSCKESTCQGRRHGFNLWVRKIPWRRKWHPTPVLLPGKSHGQRSLAGYRPWSHKESDITEQLNLRTSTQDSTWNSFNEFYLKFVVFREHETCQREGMQFLKTKAIICDYFKNANKYHTKHYNYYFVVYGID